MSKLSKLLHFYAVARHFLKEGGETLDMVRFDAACIAAEWAYLIARTRPFPFPGLGLE